MVKNLASADAPIAAPAAVRRQARGEQRREDLLRAALRVITAEGTASISQRRVAREAGVPASLPTYYFATVDELLEQALTLFAEERVAELLAVAESFTAASMTPHQISELLARALVHSSQDAEIAQLELYLEASRRPALSDVVIACLDAYRRVAEAALRAGGASRPEEGAVTFVVLMDGLGVTKASGALRDFSAQERIDMLSAMIRDVAIPYALDEAERDAWDARLGVSRRGPRLRLPAPP